MLFLWAFRGRSNGKPLDTTMIFAVLKMIVGLFALSGHRPSHIWCGCLKILHKACLCRGVSSYVKTFLHSHSIFVGVVAFFIEKSLQKQRVDERLCRVQAF